MKRIKPRDDERECDACGYPAKQLDDYPMHLKGTIATNHPDEHMTLCELCASTASGSAHEYPTHYPGGTDQVLHAICFIGNLILDTLIEHPVSRTDELVAIGQTFRNEHCTVGACGICQDWDRAIKKEQKK